MQTPFGGLGGEGRRLRLDQPTPRRPSLRVNVPHVRHIRASTPCGPPGRTTSATAVGVKVTVCAPGSTANAQEPRRSDPSGRLITRATSITVGAAVVDCRWPSDSGSSPGARMSMPFIWLWSSKWATNAVHRMSHQSAPAHACSGSPVRRPRSVGRPHRGGQRDGAGRHRRDQQQRRDAVERGVGGGVPVQVEDDAHIGALDVAATGQAQVHVTQRIGDGVLHPHPVTDHRQRLVEVGGQRGQGHRRQVRTGDRRGHVRAVVESGVAAEAHPHPDPGADVGDRERPLPRCGRRRRSRDGRTRRRARRVGPVAPDGWARTRRRAVRGPRRTCTPARRTSAQVGGGTPLGLPSRRLDGAADHLDHHEEGVVVDLATQSCEGVRVGSRAGRDEMATQQVVVDPPTFLRGEREGQEGREIDHPWTPGDVTQFVTTTGCPAPWTPMTMLPNLKSPCTIPDRAPRRDAWSVRVSIEATTLFAGTGGRDRSVRRTAGRTARSRRRGCRGRERGAGRASPAAFRGRRTPGGSSPTRPSPGSPRTCRVRGRRRRSPRSVVVEDQPVDTRVGVEPARPASADRERSAVRTQMEPVLAVHRDGRPVHPGSTHFATNETVVRPRGTPGGGRLVMRPRVIRSRSHDCASGTPRTSRTHVASMSSRDHQPGTSGDVTGGATSSSRSVISLVTDGCCTWASCRRRRPSCHGQSVADSSVHRR